MPVNRQFYSSESIYVKYIYERCLVKLLIDNEKETKHQQKDTVVQKFGSGLPVRNNKYVWLL